MDGERGGCPDGVVGVEGVEPSRPSRAPGLESGASARSATLPGCFISRAGHRDRASRWRGCGLPSRGPHSHYAVKQIASLSLMVHSPIPEDTASWLHGVDGRTRGMTA